MSLLAPADAEVGATAKLSVGEMLLSAVIDLRAGLGAMTDVLAKIEAERAYGRGVHDIPFKASAKSAATGNLMITVGGPSSGRMWEVKTLVISGITWKTTATGDGIVYREASDLTSPGPASSIVFATGSTGSTLPFSELFGTRQLTLHYPDRLSVEIAGPTANTVYVVTGTALELPDVQSAARVVAE